MAACGSRPGGEGAGLGGAGTISLPRGTSSYASSVKSVALYFFILAFFAYHGGDDWLIWPRGWAIGLGMDRYFRLACVPVSASVRVGSRWPGVALVVLVGRWSTLCGGVSCGQACGRPARCPYRSLPLDEWLAGGMGATPGSCPPLGLRST